MGWMCAVREEESDVWATARRGLPFSEIKKAECV